MAKINKKKNEAFKYYCMGLNSKEIAKLLDTSHRTVQGYMTKGKWKEKRTPSTLKLKVLELSKDGFSYTEIGERIGISKTTVYNYIRELKSNDIQK